MYRNLGIPSFFVLHPRRLYVVWLAVTQSVSHRPTSTHSLTAGQSLTVRSFVRSVGRSVCRWAGRWAGDAPGLLWSTVRVEALVHAALRRRWRGARGWRVWLAGDRLTAWERRTVCCGWLVGWRWLFIGGWSTEVYSM